MKRAIVRRVGGLTTAGLVTVLGIVAISGALLAQGRASQEDPFPHARHEGLFPVCSGCHQGIAADAAGAAGAGAVPPDAYPDPSLCAGCHDGRAEARVSWTGPTGHASNVRFDHGVHARDLQAAGDPSVTCESCHSTAGATRMNVDASAELDTCWSCHAHERSDHFGGSTGAARAPSSSGGAQVRSAPGATDANCQVCHVPLAESGFDRARLEALPAPADHDREEFLVSGHVQGASADIARCATCHTSDRCTACHVDASLPIIQQVPAAPPGMSQLDWKSAYPVPVSHEASSWDLAHRPGARGAAECSTCHTSDDCLSCHLEPAPAVVGDLVSRDEVRAPGAHIEVAAPVTHESLFFMSAHAGLAAADESTCATCHTETYCVACHDGPANGGYHPPAFVARHSAEAYGQAAECATCHNTAAFCRTCHESSGFESRGRLGAGFHDAEPIWLLRHGGAARQNLESCASCHQQTDCVQCHGVLGAFRVSPHTSDFDAEEAWARSPRTCMACHVSNPIGGGP